MGFFSQCERKHNYFVHGLIRLQVQQAYACMIELYYLYITHVCDCRFVLVCAYVCVCLCVYVCVCMCVCECVCVCIC